jgi:predicted transcriptional regulator
MRTTVTLDDDLSLRLEQLRVETGQSFKEVINEMIRIGLERHGFTVVRQSESRRPLRTLDLGEPKVDLTNVWDTIAVAEGEDWR